MAPCAPRWRIGIDLRQWAGWWPLAEATQLSRVVAAYGHPARGYHDLEHLGEVLERVDELAGVEAVGDLQVVRLAAFFHDVVYATEPGAPVSNEEASARWALEALASRVSAERAERVAGLVRATYDHRIPQGDIDAAILMDADLAILAASPQRYSRYVEGVRREYAWVPAEQFRAGRDHVLTDLLNRVHLFHTEYAREAWEDRSRDNIEAELNREL